MYGWRARIGFISPGSVVNETTTGEFYQIVPEGVGLVAINLGIRNLTDKDIGTAMGGVYEAAQELARQKVDIIVLGGSPPVIFKGHGYDQELIREMERITHRPATTSQTAAVDALQSLEAEKIAVASPFDDIQNQRLKTFLEDSGFDVLSIKGLALPMVEMPTLPLSTSYRIAKEVFREAPTADALYIPCAAWPVVENIETLERDTGIPVVTSIQAMIWKALSLLKIGEVNEGYGQLFETL
ncbi:MAG: Asp/Glu racemase [Chloroflexi bacterium]|nr:Asp/Glu racemase [Chloroflexota bacterium]